MVWVIVYSVGSTALHLREAAEAWYRWYQVRSLATVVLLATVAWYSTEDTLLSQSIDLLRQMCAALNPNHSVYDSDA